MAKLTNKQRREIRQVKQIYPKLLVSFVAMGDVCPTLIPSLMDILDGIKKLEPQMINDIKNG